MITPLHLWMNAESKSLLINSFNEWNDETMKNRDGETVFDFFMDDWYKFRGDEDSRCYRFLKTCGYEFGDITKCIMDIFGMEEDETENAENLVLWAFVDMVTNYPNNKDENGRLRGI